MCCSLGIKRLFTLDLPVFVARQVYVSKDPIKRNGSLDIKKRLVIQALSLLAILTSTALPAPADDFDDPQPPPRAARSEEGDESPAEKRPSGILIKGSVKYLVPKGTPFKLKIAMVPTHGADLHLMDRDLDGNLYPAKKGEIITARTSEDFFVDDNKVIPEGTVFHGVVSEIAPPRRVNRPGWLQISCDSLTTPDGRKFAFEAQADNFKKSTMKSKLKGLAGIASYTAGGAITGALVAYQLWK